MLRVLLVLAGVGALSISGPALATSQTSKDGARQAGEGATTSSSSRDDAGPKYVPADCDVRRPSCRKWRALASERLDKTQDRD